MAGTRGGLLGGVFVFEVGIITCCLVAWHSQALPRPLCVLGLVALVHPLGTVVSLVSGDLLGDIWVIGVASLVLGVPGWCLASGLWMLARGEQRASPSAVALGR